MKNFFENLTVAINKTSWDYEYNNDDYNAEKAVNFLDSYKFTVSQIMSVLRENRELYHDISESFEQKCRWLRTDLSNIALSDCNLKVSDNVTFF